FKEQAYLLRRYIDINKEDRSKDNSELQALYAVQAFVCSLEHPPNLINAYFQALYDLDLISEDAFIEWRSSTDPQEQTGRGVAITSLRPFFEY
ncbi:hypothetical protein HELRODRAFT_152920, partial [Helobdella robusta]|uniref:W2 domain-containing protein n=1 Tax=Helobdella robusta TaxID=6412 RepID=T1EKY2_HELRO